MVSNMAQGCGMEQKATAMLGNGNSVRLMAMVFISGSMATDTKANSNSV